MKKSAAAKLSAFSADAVITGCVYDVTTPPAANSHNCLLDAVLLPSQEPHNSCGRGQKSNCTSEGPCGPCRVPLSIRILGSASQLYVIGHQIKTVETCKCQRNRRSPSDCVNTRPIRIHRLIYPSLSAYIVIAALRRLLSSESYISHNRQKKYLRRCLTAIEPCPVNLSLNSR